MKAKLADADTASRRALDDANSQRDRMADHMAVLEVGAQGLAGSKCVCRQLWCCFAGWVGEGGMGARWRVF